MLQKTNFFYIYFRLLQQGEYIEVAPSPRPHNKKKEFLLSNENFEDETVLRLLVLLICPMNSYVSKRLFFNFLIRFNFEGLEYISSVLGSAAGGVAILLWDTHHNSVSLTITLQALTIRIFTLHRPLTVRFLYILPATCLNCSLLETLVCQPPYLFC